MNNHSVCRGVELGMAILLVTAVAFSSQMDQNFAQSQQQNSQALRQYTWKSRTEIKKSGETRNVQLALVRYDSYGMLQETPISNSPQQQLPTRGIRGLIAQKKKENFMETLDSLRTLAKSYGELRSEELQRFMAAAIVTPEMSRQQKLFRIAGSNVLRPGDSMTLWVDAVTRKQRKVEIQTTLDRKPVRIVSDFEDLPNGPTHMARSMVDYPSEELTLITENFDYARLVRW
jgi:hypothetical protein